MSLNNLLLAVTLTVLWPLGLMGVLAAAEWLERRTMAAEEVVSRRLRATAGRPPAPVGTGVVEEPVDVDTAVASWPVADRSPTVDRSPTADGGVEAAAGGRPAVRRVGGGGRHLRREAGGRGGGRHERRG
jgi:hypothetical protein